MSKTIYLIRHGEVEESFQGRYIGRTNPHLSQFGLDDCAKYRNLKGVEKIYCSPLIRARETANFIPCNNIEFIDNIQELNFGSWENLTFDEICKISTPEEIDIWTNHTEKMCFPNGESAAEFYGRVTRFFDEAKSFPEENFAVVTHGGVIVSILLKTDNLPCSRQGEVAIKRGEMVILKLVNGEWTHDK